MSTDSNATSIDFLFGNEAPSQTAEPASQPHVEQPTPPDLDNYQQSVQETRAQPHEPGTPGQEQPAQQPQQQSHQVPLSELVDMRKRAQAAEEYQRNQQREIDQLKQMMARVNQPQQPQPTPLDPMDDPEGYAYSIINAVDQRFLNMQLQQDENTVRTKYGPEFADEAYQAAQRSGMLDRFAGRPNAWTDLADWYQGRQIKERVGGDLSTYEQNLKAQLRQQIIAEMRQGTPPPSNIPPSLSQATRASPATHGEVMGSDKDFFNDMMNRKKG
jgi:hypothetical protein